MENNEINQYLYLKKIYGKNFTINFKFKAITIYEEKISQMNFDLRDFANRYNYKIVDIMEEMNNNEKE